MDENAEKTVKLLMKPLDKYFAQKTVMEIIANKPCKIDLEHDGIGWRSYQDPELDLDFWESLTRVVANVNKIEFEDISMPKVSASLPGNHRLEAAIGSSVISGLTITIRVKRDIKVKLDSFGISDEIIQTLVELINDKKRILLVGSTNSGKTTFLNTLLDYIEEPDAKRFVTVEDAAEIKLPSTNLSVQHLVNRHAGDPTNQYNSVCDSIVRQRPDYIILGEISIHNTLPFLNLVNSGHGVLTTIHANSPKEAIQKKFPVNMKLAGRGIADSDELIMDGLDVVIQLKRTNQGGKYVSEIFYPKTKKSIKFTPPKKKIKAA